MLQACFDERYWAIVGNLEHGVTIVTRATKGAPVRLVRAVVVAGAVTGMGVAAALVASSRPWWLTLVVLLYVTPATTLAWALLVDRFVSQPAAPPVSSPAAAPVAPPARRAPAAGAHATTRS